MKPDKNQKQRFYERVVISGLSNLLWLLLSALGMSGTLGLIGPAQNTQAAPVESDRRGENKLARRDLRAAEEQFNKGQYQTALNTSLPYANEVSFSNLLSNIQSEQGILMKDTSKFLQGDYSFVENLEQQPYRSKAPFASLLRQARIERQALQNLRGLTNDWKGLRAGLANVQAKLGQNVVRKPPFGEVQRWAESNDPRIELNRQAELFRVWFDVKRTNNEPMVDTGIPGLLAGTGKPAEKQPRNIIVVDYLKALDALYDGYSRLGQRPPADLKIVEAKLLRWREKFSN